MVYVIALMSCRKYLERRAKRCERYWIAEAASKIPNVKCFIVVANPDQSENYKILKEEGFETPILSVRAPDNYEGLPEKIRMMIKSISKIYSTSSSSLNSTSSSSIISTSSNSNSQEKLEGILKMDDDLFVNLKMLDYFLNKHVKAAYEGYVFNHGAVKSSYHRGRCDDPKLNNKVLDIPACLYCRGCFYYLGKDAIDCVIKKDKQFVDLLLEDVSVGYLLDRNKIFAKHNGWMLAGNDQEYIQNKAMFVAVANPDPFDTTDEFFLKMKSFTL